ncbi:MAG: hypothetical protein P1U83_18495 [Roseovarius sp.]|nr:hypothetical protein [Roseovarius sp.]
MEPEISDYELGHSLSAQRELLEQAFATGDDRIVEKALVHVTMVRRMKKNGTLEWQRPDADI